MKSITVREAQHNLSAYLKEVEAGEEIEIRRRGKPVAKLVSSSHPPKSRSPDWSVARKILDKAWGSGEALRGAPSDQILSEIREDRF
ncbi:hypothetical protein BH23VER1_BH23VER1_19020 [soil metagenome]